MIGRIAKAFEGGGRIGPARLFVGLIQGMAIYGLSPEGLNWFAGTDEIQAPLLMIVAFAPLILLAGLGHLRAVTLAAWTIGAAAVLAGLAVYDVSHGRAPGGSTPDVALVMFSAGALFIAHHLIEGADAVRRPVAPYGLYFDAAWKHAVQLAFSLAFVGVFWALLFLGAALFKLIGITAFSTLIEQAWFHFPVAAITFAAAVHLTDVKVGLITGIRAVGLTLLSWLTPVMALIAVGFLVALPFTGLKPLWDTRSAASVLLSATATLIVLINATYQDGDPERPPAASLRWAARAAALALAPLTLIVAYALWLRIGQHGLTPERVIASALALMSAFYAAGYGVAAVLPGRWMKPLEATNVANAFAALVLFIALFTPLADPVRLSVDDQVARLTGGKVAADKFDFDFLRFKAGRYGGQALERLRHLSGSPRAAAIAAGAEKAIGRTAELPARRVEDARTPPLKVYPAGAQLPAGFADRPDAIQNCQGQAVCEAYLADLDGDGVEEVLVNGGFDIAVYKASATGAWTYAATLSVSGCRRVTDALRAGRFTTPLSQWRDIEVGGVRLAVTPNADACPASAPAPTQTEGPGKL